MKEIAQSLGPDHSAAYHAMCVRCCTPSSVSQWTKQRISATSCQCSSAESISMGCIRRASRTGFVPVRSFCIGSMIACTLHPSAPKMPQVAIKFREAPLAMFKCTPVQLAENYLVIGIEPIEGIMLQFNTKVPVRQSELAACK